MVVLGRVDDSEREIRSVEALDEFLDEIGHGPEALLVELTTGQTTLNVGVGREHGAVVLFRAVDGTAWSARPPRQRSDLESPDLTFAKRGVVYAFYPHAWIDPIAMREAAREYVSSRGERPGILGWIAEPAGPMSTYAT